ncbi:CU044_2847 family protein [Streptosporangium sp. NPDC000239]|uniref:CU044_2847 family protein n=1 Tax=Streptosporangium jomthongense TaxID=1193683 RepID=A0ABV8F6R3_9ACTN
MTELVRFDIDGEEGSVLVELDPAPGFERLSRRDGGLAQAKVSFEGALAGVRDAASSALKQFQAMAVPPDEVELQFGVRLSAEAGAVIAKTGAEGHFEVRVKWQREPRLRILSDPS